MKLIVNVTTGEEQYIELTEEDLAQQAIDEAALKALDAEKQAKEQARLAVFEKLGLTEDEAKLILG